MRMQKLYVIALACATIITNLAAVGGSLLTTGFVSNYVPMSPPNPQRTVEPGPGERLFTIYLPPGYNDPENSNMRYPVVFFLPGFGGFNENFTASNLAILDNLITKGLAVPMLVVHLDPSLIDNTLQACMSKIDNPSYGNSWYVDGDPNVTGQFERYIIEELVPYIDNNFRTKGNAAFRGIMGQSMGGYGSLFLGQRHPDVFCCFASESGTPPWVYTGSAELRPGDPAFVLNSIFFESLAANNGKPSPCSNILTKIIFSMASAFSPNHSDTNSITDQFGVDLPFYVDVNGCASMIDGTFTIVDFLVVGGGKQSIVDKSIVLNQSVVDLWHQKDPYLLIDSHVNTLQKQAIYLDGGDAESVNNVSARIFSDKLIANQIDNEYLLYQGNHTSYIADFNTGRNTTVFELFSAKFSQAGVCPTNSSSKIVGNVVITLEDDACASVPQDAILSIQTVEGLADTTNVTINILDQAKLQIGTDCTPGGALQVGDPYNKALLQTGNNAAPSDLANNTVACTIIIDGPEALLHVGRQGFLGFGLGIEGKSTTDPNSPQKPNFWGLSTLANVTDMSLFIFQGTFQHDQIASGKSVRGSLLGFGQCENYNFEVDVQNDGLMLGGGNMICTTEAPNAPANYGTAIRLMHPTMIDRGNTQPQPVPNGDPSDGVRAVIDFDQNALDPYTGNPMGSTTQYTNYIRRAILSSSQLLDDRIAIDPLSINTTSLDDFCEFLATDNYQQQASKEANISKTCGNINADYLYEQEVAEIFIDSGSTFIEQFPAPVINRVNRSQMPIGSGQRVDLNAAVEKGALGVQVEVIDGDPELVRVYNLRT